MPDPRYYVENDPNTHENSFRVMDRLTGAPAIRNDTGALIDRGGHQFQDKAIRQAAHLDEWEQKQEETR